MEVLRSMGLDPVFMPDPTLLLSCDDWSELATGEGLGSIPEKYVLLYTLNSEQKLLNRALEVAGRLGIPVVCLHYNTKDFPGVLNVRDVGPALFLELVRRAAFVCTDSFHGACFSLNFNKQFVVKTSKPQFRATLGLPTFWRAMAWRTAYSSLASRRCAMRITVAPTRLWLATALTPSRSSSSA